MKKKKKKSRLLPVVLVSAAVVGGAVWFATSNYTRAGGETVSLGVTELDLRNNSLTALEQLERCTALRSLDLRGNELSAAQVTALQEKLPDCAIRWDIPLGTLRYDSELEKLVLDTLPEDWENLLLFPALAELKLNTCDNASAVAALEEAGIALSYAVPLGERRISVDTPLLTLNGSEATASELSAKLPLLRKLRTVRVNDCGYSNAEKQELLSAFPEISFVWENTVGKRSALSTASVLRFQKGEVTVSELLEALPLFPRLETVDVGDCGFSLAELNELREKLPDTHFVWRYELYGRTISSDDQEVDFSGVNMSDTAAVEAMLPYLPNLKKVIMSDCGFDDEYMDALNSKYEDVRFVWTVYFGTFNLRTDAKAFIAAKYDNWVMLRDSDCVCLKYCTDLEALDLGHMAIFDLSFVNYMPHLKYLVVVEANVADITPLGNCQELKYLEIFQCPVVDLAPLLNVKTMEDLNICYIWIPTALAFEQLSQMTWLDRLWFCGTWFTEEQKAELQSLLPDCEMDLRWGAESTGGTWRKHEHYYEMRDAFDMYYMPGGTNGLNEDGEWVVNPG